MRLRRSQTAAEQVGLRLDPDRQQTALRRIAAAREVAQYHERAAASQRGIMATLTRTWELCPDKSRGNGVACCSDPENCVYDSGLTYNVGDRVRVTRYDHAGSAGTILEADAARSIPYLVSVDDDTDDYSREHGRCYGDEALCPLTDTPV